MIGTEGHAIMTDVITTVEIELVAIVVTTEVAIVGQRTGTESLDLVIVPSEGSLMNVSGSMAMKSESIRNNDDINRVVVLSASLRPLCVTSILGNFVRRRRNHPNMYKTLAWPWP